MTRDTSHRLHCIVCHLTIFASTSKKNSAHITSIGRQEGHVDCKKSAPIFRGVSFCDAQPILALLQRRRLIKQGESLGTVLLRKSVTVLRSHALATVYVLYLN